MKPVFWDRYKAHYRDILKLGLPIVVGQLGVIVVGFADNIMVGQYDTDHLAAASFVNSVFNIPILFGLGFAYGLTPLVGQAFGRNDTGRVGGLLRNSLLANSITGLILTAAVAIIYADIGLLGQPEELLPIIRPYFILQTVSLVFVMGFNAFKQFSDGITDSLTPMFIMLGANLLNIIGNYILIYGKFGCPEMGLTGAGISTLVSRIVMLLAFVAAFRLKGRYRPYLRAFSSARCRRKDMKELARMGGMVGLQMGMETSLFSVAGVMIGWLGSAYLAAHQSLSTVSTLGFMMYYGIGAATSVKVSNYYGRGDMAGVRATTSAGFQLTIALGLMASLVFYLGRNLIGPLFTDSHEVNGIILTLIPVLILYQIGDCTQITFANALRGIGDVTSMAVISFIGYVIIALPVCYICGFVLDWGIRGIWAGFPTGLLCTGVMLCLRFYSRIRKKP